MAAKDEPTDVLCFLWQEEEINTFASLGDIISLNVLKNRHRNMVTVWKEKYCIFIPTDFCTCLGMII